MDNVKNKNGFLITCVSCIALLLLMCYFGINSSSTLKGTQAAGYICTCDEGTAYSNGDGTGYCLKTFSSSQTGWECTSNTSSSYTCTKDATCTYSSSGSGYQCWFCSGGYKWQDSQNGCQYPITLTDVDGNGSINNYDCEAKNSAVTYTATFNANGGTLSGSSTLSCGATSGSSCTISGLPTATRSGYTFKGWAYSSSATSGHISSMSLSSSATLYAAWVSNSSGGNTTTVTATFMNGSTTVAKKPCTWNDSAGEVKCSITTPAAVSKTDYVFTGWGTSSGCTSGTAANTSIDLTKDVTYYACWSLADGECYLDGGIYKWGTPSGTASVIAVGSQAECEALNVVKATFYKGSTVVSTKTCTLLSKNGSALPCTVTAPSLPSGYSYWSSSSSCSGSVSTFSVPKGGASYYACSSGGTGTSSPSTSTPTSTPTSKPTPTSAPTSTPTSKPTPIPSSNVEENPQTGEIAIFVVWVVALAAIVYSVWYFRKVKEN